MKTNLPILNPQQLVETEREFFLCLVEGTATPWEGLAERERIAAVEAWMLGQPQIQLPVQHEFIDGVYSRTLGIPSGSMLVGCSHRHECINILSKGLITIRTEGSSLTLKAPAVFKSLANTKKVGYAHEDCVFTTVHAIPTEMTVNEVESYLFVEKPQQEK